jgi:hypothetical protein
VRAACTIAALLATGCASVPLVLDNGGVPLAKTGWQLSGGADFEKRLWYVLFWKPWGAAEKDAVIDAEKIVLPE